MNEIEAIEMFRERFSYCIDYLTIAVAMLSDFKLFALCVEQALICNFADAWAEMRRKGIRERPALP